MAKTLSEISMDSRNKLYDRQEILFSRENDERNMVREIAKAMGMSMNEYCRMAVLERAAADKERMEREIPVWTIYTAELPVSRSAKYNKGDAFKDLDLSEATVVEEFDNKEAADAAFGTYAVVRTKISNRFDMCGDYALVEKTVDRKTREVIKAPRIIKYARTTKGV